MSFTGKEIKHSISYCFICFISQKLLKIHFSSFFLWPISLWWSLVFCEKSPLIGNQPSQDSQSLAVTTRSLDSVISFSELLNPISLVEKGVTMLTPMKKNPLIFPCFPTVTQNVSGPWALKIRFGNNKRKHFLITLMLNPL